MRIEVEEFHRLTASLETEARLSRWVRQSRPVTLPTGLRNAAEVRVALLALAVKAKEDAVDADDIASARAWIRRIEEANDTELMVEYLGRRIPKTFLGIQRPAETERGSR